MIYIAYVHVLVSCSFEVLLNYSVMVVWYASILPYKVEDNVLLQSFYFELWKIDGGVEELLCYPYTLQSAKHYKYRELSVLKPHRCLLYHTSAAAEWQSSLLEQQQTLSLGETLLIADKGNL